MSMTTAPDPAEVEVLDADSVWLAMAAETYATADWAYWRAKNDHDRRPSEARLSHVDQLKTRRDDAYNALVAWTATTEAARLRIERIAAERRQCAGQTILGDYL